MTDSSARINHVQASNDIMDTLNENVIGQEGITDATIVATAIDALRHATLALVEQQRIASVIAWYGEDVIPPAETLAEIREALGL